MDRVAAAVRLPDWNPLPSPTAALGARPGWGRKKEGGMVTWSLSPLRMPRAGAQHGAAGTLEGQSQYLWHREGSKSILDWGELSPHRPGAKAPSVCSRETKAMKETQGCAWS